MSVLRPVAPGVFVATSRRDVTNSVVVEGAGGSALVVDPAWTPDELDALARAVRANRLNVVAGFSTHAHFDHVLWHPGLGSAPRFASAGATRYTVGDRRELLDALGTGYPRSVTAALGAVRAGVPRVPGIELVALTHDAHSPGHAALWLPRLRVLIAGDMLSDREIPLLDERPGALDDYRVGLDLLAGAATAARLVIPGHGRPGTDGSARVDADRRYLDALAARRVPDDRRLANSGMAAAHADNLRIAHPA